MNEAVVSFLRLLPALCVLYWLLAAGAVIVTVLPVPVPDAFRRAVSLSAARGKLWHGRPKALGPIEDISVPQKWFLHFYVVGMCANAGILVWLAASTLIDTAAPEQAAALCAMTMFQVHLVRRAVETAFVMVYPPGAKMHTIAYLFGLSYYLAIPVSLVPPTVLHSVSEGAATLKEDPSILHAALQTAVSAWQTISTASPWLACLGAAIFLAGNALQFHSHLLLARLQKSSRQAAGPATGAAPETTYRVPTGGLFELVSCPHYLAEIVVYVGLLLLSRGQLVVCLMNVWVIFNLVLAARATHSWYVKRFDSYPKSRRALLPFLY